MAISSDPQLERLLRMSTRTPGPATVRPSPRESSGATLHAEHAARARVRAARPRPRIAALSAYEPETTFSQQEVLERLGLAGNAFAEGIFERCGVDRRRLDLSESFMSSTLQGRATRIEDELLRQSVTAIDALELEPRLIGTVITSSLYSLGCPTLAHRLVEHYGMDPATDKYHVTGVGCASGVPLMRLAAQAMAEHPGRQALVVAAESMSGTFTRARPGDSRAKIVASAIFGDGCAAALLSDDQRAGGPRILASRVHQLGGSSLGAVSLKWEAEDSYLHLDVELPDMAGAGVPAVADSFLADNGLHRADIDHWIVHPGGRRIISNVASALGLSDDDVECSWRTLADHGNVGTPAIMYVLDDTIKRRRPQAGERGLIVTIGPGVGVGMMLLLW